MTVVHVLERLEAVGGTPRKLLSLVRETSRLGLPLRHHFLVFGAGDLESDLERAGATVTVAGTADPAFLVRKLSALLEDAGRRTVMVSHFLRALIVCAALRRKGYRHIHFLHGRAEQKRWYSRLVTKLVLPGSDLVLSNSNWSLGPYDSIVGRRAVEARIIHNPVTDRVMGQCASSEHTDRTPPSSMRKGVLAVGGFIPTRRHDVLLEALHHLDREGTRVSLELVGDGPGRPELEVLVERLGLESVVDFAGYQRDIGPYLSRADAFVSAADNEGFGLAVAEALLAGLPVVLARNEVYQDLFLRHGLGRGFTPGDPADLARVLRDVLAKGPLPTSALERQVAKVSALYGAERFAAEFRDAVVGVHGGRPPPC